MTNQEINKIIAEFMGFKYYTNEEYNENYNELQFTVSGISNIIGSHYLSLDALVPVWDKLNFVCVELFSSGYKNCRGAQIQTKPHNDRAHCLESETIQQAAAEATAKAILELNHD